MSRKPTKDIIPLEEGLYVLVEKQINNDNDFLKQLGRDKVRDVDKVLFDRYRDYKFQKTVKYVYKKSRFYKTLYDNNNVDISEIKTNKDISKLPFTTPEDLALAGEKKDMVCTEDNETEKKQQVLESASMISFVLHRQKLNVQ